MTRTSGGGPPRFASGLPPTNEDSRLKLPPNFTANTIFRNPAWRRKDADGAMYINPEDAARLNLGDGSNARITSERGSVEAIVEVKKTAGGNHAAQLGKYSTLAPPGTGIALFNLDGITWHTPPERV